MVEVTDERRARDSGFFRGLSHGQSGIFKDPSHVVGDMTAEFQGVHAVNSSDQMVIVKRDTPTIWSLTSQKKCYRLSTWT